MHSRRDSGFSDDQSELHSACRSGTLDEVLKCLQSFKSSRQWFHDGHTPIHAAILSGREDMSAVVKALLDTGADINAKTKAEGNTAFHLVVLCELFHKNIAFVRFILSRKVDLTIRNKTLRTPYDCAIATGQYELARVIDGSLSLERAEQLYKKNIAHRYGPFIIESVLASREEQLNKYIELGGDPNTVNKYRAGAIHYTVTHSDLPVYGTLDRLVKAGADPNLKDEEDDTALNLVIKSPRLREDGQMTKCVELLVDAGARSDIQNWDGKDAFTLAEEKGYKDIVKILKKKTPRPQKDDINSPNANGLCPIHEATLIESSTQRHSKINSLIARGVEISRQIASSGNTALHLCAENDYGETATVLLDNHIDYTIKNKKGKTAYDIAKDMGHQSVVIAVQQKKEGIHENWQKARKKTKFCAIL